MAIIADEFYAKNRAEWRKWLSTHHEHEKSVWLVYDKGKNRTMSYDDIVEEALCFGWVDSIPGKVDDLRSKLYVSKRKPKSVWSKANKERIEKLTSQGLLTNAGMNAVTVAKENGSWDALNKSDALELPIELAEQFKQYRVAKEFYDALSPSSKRILLEWIYGAKTEKTRLNRINETVQLAAKGIKAYPK